MKLMWKRTTPAVVESVQDQTTKAEHLARIPGQDRLGDPRTNPAVRALLDQLRNEQHRMQLEAEHGRAKRRHRVDDRHRAEAELTLHAILQAKQASSPARSVLALHRGRTWFMGASLTASVSLSVGSAFGVGHLADELGAPKVTGWVAEVGMVGLSTIVILYLAHLFRHGWVPSPLHRLLLGFLAIGPLLGSVVANAFGAGPVGVACSVGAALFGVFSHLVSDNSAGALRKKADEVGMEDAQALRVTALGDDLFALPAEPRTTEEVPEPEFANHQVQVHAEVQEPPAVEVHEPAVSEVREPQQVPNHAPEPANPEPGENRELVNPEPQVHEPAPAEPANSEVPNHEPTTQHKSRTKPATSLNDRAQRKAAEVQQVVDLIRERGEDAVTLNVVREELEFAKTTAYHRLVAARELVNQAVAS